MTNIAKILLIDDDRAFLNLLGRILQKESYEIMPAQSGKDGLIALEHSGQFDLILCDIMMDEMNGFHFLHVVKIHPEWSNIPFVFLSGKDDPKSRYEGMLAGADDYIYKPVHKDEILLRINRFLK